MPPFRIEWLDEAAADVRRLDRPTAMRIFDGVLHHARIGRGGIEPLHGDRAGDFRSRLGHYRVMFALRDNVMRISGVRHRAQTYRQHRAPSLPSAFRAGGPPVSGGAEAAKAAARHAGRREEQAG